MTQPALPKEIQQLMTLPNIIRVPDHHKLIRSSFHLLTEAEQNAAIEKARGFLSDAGNLRAGKEPIEVVTAIKQIAASIPA